MIATPGGFDFVSAAQRMVAYEMRLHKWISRLWQVAELSASHKPGVTLQVKPTAHSAFDD
jgi:hypothetical protein